jgi:cyclophilin family peptidyl-prolyl cis-trans isomerase
MAVMIGGLAAAAGAQTGATTSKPATAQTAKSAPAQPAAPVTPASPGAGPVVVVETAKGTFEFETYPKDAPKTVEHILALVKKNFYNGQRFHRVVEDFVVQWGDPKTKDMRQRGEWGTGGSGSPIGVAEISKTRKHKLGAVAMGHAGDPARADSQMYVVTGPATHLDGGYTIFGQVISGMDVVMKIRQNDTVTKMSIRAETPAAK